jgi:hypothetical protein
VKIEAEAVQDLKDFRSIEMQNVLSESEERGLRLQKPTRLGTGKTMTIAHRPDYIQTKENGLVDMDRTIDELRKWESASRSTNN